MERNDMNMTGMINPFIKAVFIFLSIFFSAFTNASDLPKNMIFFYDGTVCPAGSFPAPNAAGRMLLAVSNVSDVNKTYGVPLANQEDRTHTHTGSMSVDIGSKSIAGASSCCNSQATRSGTKSADMTTAAATSGLPFFQILVCQVK
jgi:hypothetical protein